MATTTSPPDTPKPPLPKASRWRVLKARVSTATRLLLSKLGQNGPQWLIAILALATGVVQISPQFVQMRQAVLNILAQGADGISGLADLAAFPHVIIGIGLILMVPGLLLRARVAWVLGVLLSALSAGLALWAAHGLNATLRSRASCCWRCCFTPAALPAAVWPPARCLPCWAWVAC